MSILSHQKLVVNETKTLINVQRWLVDCGYEKVDEVKFWGQYSIFGDRLTVYAVNQIYPTKIDFFGNVIERITTCRTPEKTEAEELRQVEFAPNILDADGLRFEPGQYVVHMDHGIGQFRTMGMREWQDESLLIKGSGIWSPYLILDYAEGAELYVPPEQAGKLTHYIGGRSPQLSKLGSQRWQTTKKHVEESLFKLARELLEIAAKREIKTRPSYKIQNEWLSLVVDEFPYVETDDQQRAIDAILNDFMNTRPMDRLICGDVGFGKTEVALRAITAAVSAGKQVAVLAPTTLLVEQHFATISERLKGLPIAVAKLSRFVSSELKQKTAEELAKGLVDVVVGTHALLKDGISFKNLALLVIDEEQRFGVRHKEKLKKMRAEIDVLTLSATPIPRTLFSGLSGLRDISLIMTPPAKRLPIKTEIIKKDDEKLVEYVSNEIKRGGQVFILHNDVVSIAARVRVLRQLMPDMRIEFAHGQMPETQLAKTMSKMIAGEIDILVTSTIIESGLDMPNVNTLIVEKADRFGLADLYQLRGRVGRSDRQAHALFFYDVPELTKEAQLRFKALKESEELGSGYNIAIRDLEIRGGGNVLGKEQHGNMEAVGLSLYTKMLKLTVERLKELKK